MKTIVVQYGDIVSVSDIDAGDEIEVNIHIPSADQHTFIHVTPEQAVALARALLAAAGEPGATSKIVPNRVVEPQHTFEIGDYVQIKDDIRGHIVDFQDAEAIVKGDMGQLVGAYIGDIEYIDDEQPSVDETAK